LCQTGAASALSLKKKKNCSQKKAKIFNSTVLFIKANISLVKRVDSPFKLAYTLGTK